ncbi:baseplate J/gp47 family protein [Sessilibacter corallicola]|uniref:baseplate J/gp47 family protein n=1 Tax=Sessilibacter corallicola TaxID=2904075 RepID=UPI001E457B2C|nr:baseplate J/gp47 family protein [Sessilibacter corallicola]MCE2029303.1 baseplate J/gp47 family protein [Sessilibacter corallicola]
MADVLSNGYLLKTQDEYFEEEIALYREIDPNWNLDSSTPDGLKAASDAEIFSILDQALQQAYNSKDPSQARDGDLDTICSLTGTERDLGSFSTVEIRVFGVDGTTIEEGSLVESEDGTRWSTNRDVNISGGFGVVTATATTLGAIEAPPGTVTRIITVTGGWQSVSNIQPATPGRGRQSNASLRRERQLTVGRPSDGQLDSIIGEVFAVTGVRSVVANHNITVDPIDSNGVPIGRTYIIVDGGNNAEIARAIYSKHSAGSPLFAAGTPIIERVQSLKYPQQFTDILFSRPLYADMEVRIVVDNDGTLPGTASNLIENSILRYIDANEIQDGFNTSGFGIGDNVPVSRLSTPINQIIGAFGNSSIQSLTVNGMSSGEVVPIQYNQTSRWTRANIIVSVVQ